MGSFNSEEMLKTLLRNNGVYPGEPRAFSIHSYENNWGGTTFHLASTVQDDVDFRGSPNCHKQVLLWSRKRGITEEGGAYLKEKKWERKAMSGYWIVICPVERMRTSFGSLWIRLYEKHCVAVGLDPHKKYSLEGRTRKGGPGWELCRKRLKRIGIGDKVIPYAKKWRLGNVGTVMSIEVADDQWSPTLRAEESERGKADLGRRIVVEWEEHRMPPNGLLAKIPKRNRPRKPHGQVVRQTLTPIRPAKFKTLCSILSNSSNWVNTTGDAHTKARNSSLKKGH